MATNLTVNGTTYSYPNTGDSNWGDNATNWATAVSNSTLQLNGGSFVLTADADFGANFGLKSIYYKSRATNLPTVGVVRLGNGEKISWRNAGNTTNYSLKVDAGNALNYNDNFTCDPSGNGSFFASLQAPYFFDTSNHPATAGVVRLGTAQQVAWRNNGNSANGILYQGTGTTNDPLIWSVDSGDANFQIGDGTNNTRSQLYFNPASGSPSKVNLVKNTGLAIIGSSSQTLLNILEAGVVALGTTTNDSAATGYVGEYVSSTVGFTNVTTSTHWKDGTSISLTAGDWDVSLVATFTPNGGTVTIYDAGISVTTGDFSTGLTEGDNWVEIAAGAGVHTSLSIPVYRKSLSTTTIIYAKINATFSAGTPQYACRLSARRVR